MINIKKRDKCKLSYVTFTLLVALYYTIIVNIPVYKELAQVLGALDSFKIGFVISIPIFFFAVFNFLFNLFSWPWFCKPFFMVLLILSSAVSYAGYNYGTLFDFGMIVNIFETDTSEATSYLSLYSALWVLMMGVVPALLVFNVKFCSNGKIPIITLILSKLASMIASLVVVGIIAGLYYQDYASIGRNNRYLTKLIVPTQFVYSTFKYIKEEFFTTPLIYRPLGLDAKQSPYALMQIQEKPTLLVFILGETARSQNYELNGYNRPTNQYTRDLDVISFQDVNSCGTSTSVSVPCLFSNLTRENFVRKLADSQDNVLNIIERADVSVLWKENDGGHKDVANKLDLITIDRSRVDEMCNGSTCLDMALLEDFEQNVESMSGNRVLVLHLIGSHGPTYFQRYPKDKAIFLPDCPRADIENCSVEEIINTYDNTIVYTDYVMSQVIEKLKGLEEKYNTALLYVSDHGESLGENGLFLHGLPYSLAPDFQTKVPMILWMSPGFKEIKNINYDCLKNSAQKRDMFSHDNIFHSVLGLMDVETKEYDPSLDIFMNCRMRD